MSDLVGNPEDRFSRDAADMMSLNYIMSFMCACGSSNCQTFFSKRKSKRPDKGI